MTLQAHDKQRAGPHHGALLQQELGANAVAEVVQVAEPLVERCNRLNAQQIPCAWTALQGNQLMLKSPYLSLSEA